MNTYNGDAGIDFTLKSGTRVCESCFVKRRCGRNWNSSRISEGTAKELNAGCPPGQHQPFNSLGPDGTTALFALPAGSKLAFTDVSVVIANIGSATPTLVQVGIRQVLVVDTSSAGISPDTPFKTWSEASRFQLCSQQILNCGTYRIPPT